MPEQEFGSDGQLRDIDTPFQPGNRPPPGWAPQPVDPFEASEPASAAQRLRAFEDKHLGADTPRYQGKVERGSGALLHNLPDDLRREHAALEARSESEKGSG